MSRGVGWGEEEWRSGVLRNRVEEWSGEKQSGGVGWREGGREEDGVRGREGKR
jgi:hypothetical protein